MADQDHTYEITAAALPDFLARIAVLSKKSMKLLGKPITADIHGEAVRPCAVGGRTCDDDGNRYVRTYHIVSVTAETPKIHGWRFIATIDHRHAAGNLIRAMPGSAELPLSFRTAAPYCQHCDTQRRRVETFVLCSDGGEYKQIGRQCLRDFIGHDVTTITQMAAWLSGMEPADDDGTGGSGGGRLGIFLNTYLAHVHALIRVAGWISRKEAEVRHASSTAGDALSNMFPMRGQRVVPLTEKDYAVAETAIAWGRGLTGRSDFDHNLAVIAGEEFIDGSSIGLAAYLVPGLFRHQEAEIKRAERAVARPTSSDHLGVVGQRLRGVTAKVSGYRAFASRFGATHLFRLLTPEQHELVWFASSEKDLSIGQTVVLDGTVKKHEVYQDVKQTVLTRCVIQPSPTN